MNNKQVIANPNDEWGNIELPGLSDEKLLNTNWNYVDSNRRKAQDPKWKEKMKQAADAYKNTETFKEKCRVNGEKLRNNPDWLEKISNLNKERAKDPTWKEKMKQAGKNLKNNLEWRKNVTQANKIKSQDQEIGKKISKALTGKKRENNPWDNPEYVAKQQTYLSDPKVRKAKSQKAKEFNNRLETRIKHGKPIMTSKGQFPGRGFAAEVYSIDWNCSLRTASDKLLKLLKDDNCKDFYYID